MEQRFTLATKVFFTLAGMMPEVRLGSRDNIRQPTFQVERRPAPPSWHSVGGEESARELADAGDEVGAAGVPLYLGDEG